MGTAIVLHGLAVPSVQEMLENPPVGLVTLAPCVRVALPELPPEAFHLSVKPVAAVNETVDAPALTLTRPKILPRGREGRAAVAVVEFPLAVFAFPQGTSLIHPGEADRVRDGALCGRS